MVRQIRVQLRSMVRQILLQLLPNILAGPRSPVALENEHGSQPDQRTRQEKIEQPVPQYHANACEGGLSDVLTEGHGDECEEGESGHQPLSVVPSCDSFWHEQTVAYCRGAANCRLRLRAGSRHATASGCAPERRACGVCALRTRRQRTPAGAFRQAAMQYRCRSWRAAAPRRSLSGRVHWAGGGVRVRRTPSRGVARPERAAGRRSGGLDEGGEVPGGEPRHGHSSALGSRLSALLFMESTRLSKTIERIRNPPLSDPCQAPRRPGHRPGCSPERSGAAVRASWGDSTTRRMN